MAGAKLYIIPHPDNGHWPHLLHHHRLAEISTLLIFLKVAAVGIVALAPNIAYLSTITTNRIVQLTNEERGKVGVLPLTVNPELSQAALQKGQDMLANQYFAHISPSGITPWFWMKKAGYSYAVAGENLAIDFVDAEGVVTAWLNSPSHKANMLSKEYTETGIAVVTGSFQGGTSIIVVHMFGLPLGSLAPAGVLAGTQTFSKPTSAPPVSVNVSPPSLLLSPAFDRDEIAPIREAPSFVVAQPSGAQSIASTIVSLSRKATAGILLAIAILLSLAIVVRIRIQHPALIAHASLVILLASILLIA